MVNNSLNFLYALINNASVVNRGDITIPTTKKSLKVLQLLYREGLIRGYTYNEYKTTVFIKFLGNKPVIKHIQAISNNGRPIFVTVKMLAKLIHANETFIISSPKGLFTLKEALQQNIGGVLLCKII